MKFLCIGYLDEKKWAELSYTEQEQIIADYAQYYKDLKKSGNFLFGYGLTDVTKGVRIQRQDMASHSSDIPHDSVQLGGVFLLEASSLDEAKTIVAQHPGLSLGPFDVRPVDEALTDAVGA